jgi:SprA-related family
VIQSISAESGAAALANVYLRELGASRKGRRPSPTPEVAPTTAAKPANQKSELTDEEKKQVEELKQNDAEVRRHESAHKAAAGSFAKGGPTFEYTRGPDGKQYATSGEVQIDTSEASGDPQATIRKMQKVRSAASAPAEPSSTDRQVAAQAARTEAKARSELAKQRNESPGRFIDVIA